MKLNWVGQARILVLLGVFAFSGCGKESSSGIPTSVTPTTVTTSTTNGSGGAAGSLPAVGQISSGPSCQLVSSAYPTAPFAVRVYTQWPYAETWNRVDAGACETSTLSSTPATCTVSVPEAQLHYSKTYFEIFALNGSSQCDVIYYQPYYYIAGNGATDVFPWSDGEEVDCTNPYDSADCFNGAAKGIVTGFPKKTGLFFTIKDLSYTKWCAGSMVDSGHNGQEGWGSNRWMTNSLAAGSRAANQAGYVGGSMQDWYFSCVNRYGDILYAITLTLTDVNTDGGGPNDHSAWP